MILKTKNFYPSVHRWNHDICHYGNIFKLLVYCQSESLRGQNSESCDLGQVWCVKITHACENPRTSDCRHNVQVIICTVTPVAYYSYDSLRLLIFFCWTAWEGETAWLARNCHNQGVSIAIDHSLWTVQDPSTQYWTSEDSVETVSLKNLFA